MTMDSALFERLVAAMVAKGGMSGLTVNEPPPGTDPEQRGNWQSQPAPDGRFVGIRPTLPKGTTPYYPLPEGENPDSFPFFQATPMPQEAERAYHPTLQYENSMPYVAELERAYQANQRAGRNPGQYTEAQEFQRPKTLAEIFGRR
jgi:hypothetical protein